MINPLQCNINALLLFQAYCEEPSLLLKVKELIVWFCHTLSVGITHVDLPFLSSESVHHFMGGGMGRKLKEFFIYTSPLS